MDSKVRILIADNSKDFVWLLVQFLSKYPEIEIVGAAYNGKQTIQMVEQTNPDVLLLDIIMPSWNGFMVLNEIRNKKDLKIIAMSALRNERMIENAMDLGVIDYLEKPFKLYDLYVQIRECVE